MLDINAVKKPFDDICCTIKKIFTMAGVDFDVDKAVKIELSEYMMYLSASDGKLKVDEMKVISNIYGSNLTSDAVSNYISKHDIYSDKFRSTVPHVLNLLVQLDNLYQQTGVDLKLSISEVYVNTYKTIGNIFIESDRVINDHKRSDYNIYIKMLEKYVDENLDKRDANTIGFAQKGNNIPAPKKRGVNAPKKG